MDLADKTLTVSVVTSASPFSVEAHAGFFKFDVYLLSPFWEKVDFHIINTC